MVDPKYLYEYATWLNDLENRNINIISDYLRNVNCSLGLGLQDIYSLFDKETGAIFLKDNELVLLKQRYQKHALFAIFDCDCLQSKRQYTCNLNDKIIMRGSKNYYIGLCYTSDINVKQDEMLNAILSLSLFFKLAFEQMKNNKYLMNQNADIHMLDLKLYLGLIDCLRNTLCIIMYLLMKKSLQPIILYSRENDYILQSTLSLLEQLHYGAMALLFEGNINIDLCKWIDTACSILKELFRYIQNLPDDNYYLYFRKFRECDNLLENYFSTKHSIQSLVKDNNLASAKSTYVFGLNYGSLDIAIIAHILLKKYCVKSECGNIMIKFRHTLIKDHKCLNSAEQPLDNEKVCIIIDENILTGITIDSAANYIRSKGIYHVYRIVLKYPPISRLSNIAAYGNESKIVGMLNNTYGLHFSAQYSKLLEIRHGFIFKFMDRVGAFDLSKYSVYMALLKNNDFIKGSAIDRIAGNYRDLFV